MIREEQEPSRNAFSAPLRIRRLKMIGFCRNHQIALVPVLFVLSMSLFMLSYHFNSYPIFALLRPVMGVFSLLIVPGAIVTNLLPERVVNIGTTVVAGLVFQVFAIQLLYMTKLLLGVSMDLIAWIALVNLVFVTIGTYWLNLRKIQKPIEVAIRWDFGLPIGLIIVASFLLRMVVLFFAQGCLAPDSSLYADFAREIVQGGFESSVSNDSAVNQLTTSVAYLSHHAFTYVFAVSWLLMPPSTQGPTLILVIIGVLVVFFAFLLTKDIFGKKAAIWIGAVVSVHPLFVFHSTVGYGPEITSLLFLLCVGFFILKGFQASHALALLTGLLIGLVDVVWYANFYIMCVLLPILFILTRSRFEELGLGVFLLFPLVLAARVYYLSMIPFYVIWTLVFTLFFVMVCRPETGTHQRDGFLLLGVFLTIVSWRLPVQVHTTLESLRASFIAFNPINLLPSMPSLLYKTPNFTIFVLLHVSPVLLTLIPLAIWKGSRRDVASIFTALGTVSLLVTLFVLSTVPGSLEMMYFFSDSRFFLLSVTLLILSVGAVLPALGTFGSRTSTGLRVSSLMISRRTLLVAGLIFLGFTPSFLAMPSGLALIDMEERYGWKDLPEILRPIGDEHTVFLADRVREFAWFTDRQAAYLGFTRIGLDSVNATREIMSLAANFSTEYLIVDDYTIAKWKTLQFLLIDPIDLGDSVMLNLSDISSLRYENNTGAKESLTLVAETEPNDLGRMTRVYSFDSRTFTKFHEVEMVESGWNATKSGSIVNLTGDAQLVIGHGQNSTSTWRPHGYDLGLEIMSGFMLFDVEEVDSEVDRIEIWDASGLLIREAEAVGDGLYFCYLGDITIGDIRVQIEGDEGDSVLIQSISLWQAT